MVLNVVGSSPTFYLNASCLCRGSSVGSSVGLKLLASAVQVRPSAPLSVVGS